MSELVDVLRSYVPWLVSKHFVGASGPLREPTIEHFEAAIFFADISGFSKLARHLSSEESSAGPERLSAMLNDYFGALIDIVWGHGGDIVKFAGDGLYAVWPLPAHDKPIEDLVYAALQAAQTTQQQLSNYELETGHRLSLRIGISAGEIGAATVGGVLRRWEFSVGGLATGRSQYSK